MKSLHAALQTARACYASHVAAIAVQACLELRLSSSASLISLGEQYEVVQIWSEQISLEATDCGCLYLATT